MRRAARSCVARRVGVAPGQQVIGERAERVQIGARVERLQLQRFGRHERRRADDCPWARPSAPSRRSRSAWRGRPACSARCAPRRRDAASRASAGSRATRRRRAAARRLRATAVLPRSLEVAAVEQLHRVVRAALVDAVVVDLDDARVRELRRACGTRARAAPRASSALRGSRAKTALERERAPGALVAHAIHRAHAAAAEPCFEDVAAGDRRPELLEGRRYNADGHRPIVARP